MHKYAKFLQELLKYLFKGMGEFDELVSRSTRNYVFIVLILVADSTVKTSKRNGPFHMRTHKPTQPRGFRSRSCGCSSDPGLTPNGRWEIAYSSRRFWHQALTTRYK